MSKKKETVIRKSETYESALVKKWCREMIDRLNQNCECDESRNTPLISKETKEDNVRSLGDDWQIPSSVCYNPDTNEDIYLPGHLEIDTNAPPNTFINLLEKYQGFGKEEYMLGRTVFMIKPMASSKPELYYMTDNYGDRLDAFITAGSYAGNPARAFIKAYGKEQETRYFEPEEFCMLAMIDETCDTDEAVFTYFNKSKALLYTGFVIGSPGFKDFKLSGAPLPNEQKSEKLSEGTAKMIRDICDKMVAQYSQLIETGKQKQEYTRRNLNDEILALLPEKQERTQEQMRNLCRIIRHREQYNMCEYTVIDFMNKTLKSHDYGTIVMPQTPYLGMVVKPLNGKVININFQKSDKLDALIIAGNIGGSCNEAFLVVKRGDGAEHIVELEFFNLLSVHYKCKENNSHYSFFILFNKVPNVLYDDYCMVCPGGEHYLLCLDGKSFPPITDKERK